MKSANPQDNLDLFSAEELKRVGIAEVVGHTPTSWRFAMLAVAQRLIGEGKQFTAEDLTDAVGMPPNHWNAVGGIMHWIVRQLGLKSYGRAKGRRASTHARKMEVWGK